MVMWKGDYWPRFSQALSRKLSSKIWSAVGRPVMPPASLVRLMAAGSRSRCGARRWWPPGGPCRTGVVEEFFLGGAVKEGAQLGGDLLGGGGLHPLDGLGHGVDGALHQLGVGLDEGIGGDHGEELIAGRADDVLDHPIVGAVHDDHAAGVGELLGGPGLVEMAPWSSPLAMAAA